MSESNGSSSFDDGVATSEGRAIGDELTDRGGRETNPATGDAISADDPTANGSAPDLDGAGERDIDDSGLTKPDNAEGATPRTWP